MSGAPAGWRLTQSFPVVTRPAQVAVTVPPGMVSVGLAVRVVTAKGLLVATLVPLAKSRRS